MKNFTLHDGDAHSLTGPIKLLGTVFQKSFRDLHEEILDSFLMLFRRADALRRAFLKSYR